MAKRTFRITLSQTEAEYLEIVADRMFVSPEILLRVYIQDYLTTQGFKSEVQRRVKSKPRHRSPKHKGFGD